jgi:threonine dehydrogenase-like Zn-dependent dehydrogenase
MVARKFLIVGLGSMGRRRIRSLKYLSVNDLKYLSVNDIIGFDIRKDRCKDAKEKYGIETFLPLCKIIIKPSLR